MALDKENYKALITSQYQTSTNFMAWLDGLLGVVQDTATAVENLDYAFDLDYAIGLQLDALGEMIGIPRRINYTILSADVGFTWDDAALGWDDGLWVLPALTLLNMPDDIYRQVLKIKVVLNSWSGSVNEAYIAWDNLFHGDPILVIENNKDMTMELGIIGTNILGIIESLFAQEAISFRPTGVDCTYHFNSTGSPFFAWGGEVEGVYEGWDSGYWAENWLSV